MDTNDLELKLCSNDPIYVDGVPIFPIPISRISQIGYSKYITDLRLLCLSEDDIKILTDNDVSEDGVFPYLIANALHSDDLMRTLIFWLSEITRCKVIFSERRLCFIDLKSPGNKT